ncbi:MAG: TonB-dependent receptor [bacterium]
MNNKSIAYNTFQGRPTAVAVAVSTAVAGTSVAQAQTTIEEVIVTATKRESSVQDIPMSVTAFTDADIVLEGFKGMDDYAGKIPGLTVNRREPGGSNVIMRGCAVSAVNFGGTATTSVYLDEQPITAAGANPDPRLVDINRVEALSGPQGSLFGDAAQCGTLRIITNKPDPSASEGWVDITGSSISDGDTGYDVSAMVNIPLVEDKLALRLVGFRAEEAGFIDNIRAVGLPGPFGPTSGAPYDNSAFAKDDVNSTDVTGGRVGLRWLPNDSWTIDALATYQDVEADGFGDSDLAEGVHAGFQIGELEQIRYSEDKWQDEWYQLALTAEGQLGFADVLLTGSFMNRKTRYDADSTAYANTIAVSNGFAGGYYDFGERVHFSNNDSDTDTETFEARISTPADSDSKWAGIMGVFYNKTTDFTVFTANGVGLGDNCVETQAYSPYCAAHHAAFSYLHYYYFGTFNNVSDNWWTGVYNSTIKQQAVFGEVAFDVSERLTITAGGRWFNVDEDRTLQNGGNVNLQDGLLTCYTEDEKANFGPGNPIGRFVHNCFNDAVSKSDESGFVPKVNATYELDDDRLVYFTYSEGFRRGGVNAAKQGPFASGGNLHRYDSDTMINFEAGLKGTYLDGSLQFNVTAYHMIWEDVQIQVNDPTGTFFALGIVNLAEAEINGLETQFQWLPADRWSISGNIGYNDAKLSETVDDVGFGVTLPKGERLPLMSEWKSSVTAEYTFANELWGAEPYVLGTWNYRSDSLSSLAGLGGTTALNAARVHPSHSTVNLRAGLNGDDWSASIFINNVFDDNSTSLFNDRWVQSRATRNQPTTFGINFRKNFGG